MGTAKFHRPDQGPTAISSIGRSPPRFANLGWQHRFAVRFQLNHDSSLYHVGKVVGTDSTIRGRKVRPGPPKNVANFLAATSLRCNGVTLWPRRHSADGLKFANYVALLPERVWIRRVLAWQPRAGRLGRTSMTWDTPIQKFIRRQHLGRRIPTAPAIDLWPEYFNSVFLNCALGGLPTGMLEQSVCMLCHVSLTQGFEKK